MSHRSSRFSLISASLLASFLAGAAPLAAQTAVSGWQLTTTDAADQTSHGVRYRDTTAAVTQFTAGSNDYVSLLNATNVYVRRNTGSGNSDNTSTWYAADPNSNSYVLGTPQTSLGSLLTANNVYEGGDNIFANGTSANQGDIERLDFVMRNGVSVSSNQGFAIFERGLVNQHDGVVIAAITGFNTFTNQPTSFSAPITISATNYGTSNLLDLGNENLYRYSNGDNINSTPDAVDTTANQGIGGVFVSFADLGISSGTTIYGYALFAVDVTTTNSANLVNWNNTTYYPSNTSSATGLGGIDLAAVNGSLYRVVPEPSTYGAIITGLGLVAFALRRRFAAKRA